MAKTKRAPVTTKDRFDRDVTSRVTWDGYEHKVEVTINLHTLQSLLAAAEMGYLMSRAPEAAETCRVMKDAIDASVLG